MRGGGGERRGLGLTGARGGGRVKPALELTERIWVGVLLAQRCIGLGHAPDYQLRVGRRER
jgi:hypothetical protein